MAFFSWSRTAASNGTADPAINWAEGMAPSGVNDSGRSMMARIREFGDDISGAIVTGGTLNAYTVTSYQVFDTLPHLNGQMIAFSPHVTNGDTVTLNVDGLGAKPLRSAPGVELVAGTLVQGTPYVALYNNADGAFYLRGYVSSPFNIPFLGGCDFWDTIAPNSAFIFPAGQAISRTVYARAFARWGTTFGAGDGSTTFGVPDKRGRVSAMLEGAASRLTATYFGGNSTLLGAVGGLESHLLITGEIPAHNHAITDPGHNHTSADGVGNSGGAAVTSGGGIVVAQTFAGMTIASHATGITINNAGGGAAHAIVQPTICCNYILRII